MDQASILNTAQRERKKEEYLCGNNVVNSSFDIGTGISALCK
jgi:hypothetical protein